MVNAILPFAISFEYFYSQRNKNAKNRIELVVILLQLVTCLVLTIAVFRIRKIVNQVKGLDIKTGRLMLHLTSFWFYFISYLIYYLLYRTNKRSGYGFVGTLLFTVLTETFSAVVLIYIVWEFYCISLIHDSKD